MKLNKTNVTKALKGWGASGKKEIPQIQAIDEILTTLEAGLGESKTYRPIGGLFVVSVPDRSITRCSHNGTEIITFIFD